MTSENTKTPSPVPRVSAAMPDWSGSRFLPLDIEVESSAVRLRAGGEELLFRGRLFAAEADAPLEGTWTVKRREFVILSLRLRATRDARLHSLTWFAGEWTGADERAVHSTALMDNALVLRRGAVSFFLSLDFPFSRITDAGISYPPGDIVRAGRNYQAHSLTLGACRCSGQRIGEWDRAEIEALSAYVERRYPPRFDRPMLLSACITNRMTDCRDGRVFYSMADNPTLFLQPSLLADDIRLCGRAGIEYFQVFEGMFDWPDERRTGSALRRLTALAARHRVRLGDYVNPQGFYCAHYNYEHRELRRPEWQRRDAQGNLGPFCLGCDEYFALLRDRVVKHNRRYGTRLICFDFLDLHPCWDEHHGHPPGDVYRQIRNLVALCRDLQALHPEFLVWTNSGNWIDLMPKFTWYNPNVYLTDPHVRHYAPTLNALKLLGDGRREQMVSVHETFFVPYRAFTNCEYYAFPRSRIPDVRFFEYSLLQGLAVTPNVCPAELRPFLNRVPAPQRRQCLSFLRHWTDFLRTHFDVWKQTLRVGDPPGIGAAEIYAHIGTSGGFLALVNQNPFRRIARFRMDGSIGLSASGPFLLREIYPRACPVAEQPLPFAQRGDEIRCDLPPSSVRFLEVQPAPTTDKVRVYGWPARVRRVRGGYSIRLRAPQGLVMSLGLALPPNERVQSVSARMPPSVPLYTFPAAAELLDSAGPLARLRVECPRTPAPRELARWSLLPGNTPVTLPSPGFPFLGALLSGAWSEEYDVDLHVATTRERKAAPTRLMPADPGGSPPPVAIPPASRHRLETRFDLPFIEPSRFGCMPAADDDTVLELAFADPARVRSLSAWLNERPAEVRRYPYPRKPEWHSFYLELTGAVDPGPVHVRIEIEWAPDV